MKILFLDFDGVICLSTEWGSRYKTKTQFDRFNAKALKVLNEILLLTDCEIVVSSDWRFHCTLEEMRNLFSERGIQKLPLDYTPNSVSAELLKDVTPKNELELTRCAEINQWLEEHPEVTSWVAVDDLDLSKLTNFVRTTRSSEGIKQVGIKEKIIWFLNI